MKASFSFKTGGLILAPITITHRNSCRPMMAMDTGSLITMINPEVALEVGIDLDNTRSSMEIIGVTGSTRASIITLNEMSLLGLSVKKVKALVHPLSPKLGLDGILGLNFLQHFNLDINHDTNNITVEKSQSGMP